MSAPYLSQLRSGKRDNPSPATMQALARFFGVDVAYFTDDLYAKKLDDELEALSQVRGARPESGYGEGVDSKRSDRNKAFDDYRAGKYGAAPPRTELDKDIFAIRLNELFDSTLKPTGLPYSPHEVAAALQSEGLPVTATLVSRLRSGCKEPPSLPTIEAIAYFFNVSPEYFAERSISQHPRDLVVRPHVTSEDAPEPSSTTDLDHLVPTHVQLSEASLCISALVKSSMRYLDIRPPDAIRARRLMVLASDLSLCIGRTGTEFVEITDSFSTALREAWLPADACTFIDRALYNRLTTNT